MQEEIGTIYLETWGTVAHLWRVQGEAQYELIMDTSGINTGYILTVDSHRTLTRGGNVTVAPKLINILYGISLT